jgi:ribosome biogenesis GTPase / thiamine phosphate phosphatase
MSVHELEGWGWNDSVAAAWAAAATAGVRPQEEDDAGAVRVPGRVVAEHRGAWDLATLAGTVRAGLGGRLRRDAASGGMVPAVGDWVVVRPADGVAPSAIVAILPRRTAFVRREPGREAGEQVVAANVDTVLIVTAVGRDVNPRRIERYLAVGWGSGADPVVVVNKADLRDGLADAMRIAGRASGVAPVLAVSARTGDGLEALAALARAGSTVALLGSSGVGKSSLVNALLGEARLDTGDVRADDDRGRHTTTSRMLLPLPGGGCLLDTPGMREIGMSGSEGDGALDAAFADVAALAASCRFADCAHESEPGCAVRRAVDDGTLSVARLESHRRLLREARDTAARLEARGRAEERRETRRRGVMYREILRAKYGSDRDR